MRKNGSTASVKDHIMASSSGTPTPPTPAPRQTRPVPKPRTKTHVFNDISFTSPLEDESVQRVRNSVENKLVIPSPDSVDVYETVSIPPPYPPCPPLLSTDLEVYDFPRPLSTSQHVVNQIDLSNETNSHKISVTSLPTPELFPTNSSDHRNYSSSTGNLNVPFPAGTKNHTEIQRKFSSPVVNFQETGHQRTSFERSHSTGAAQDLSLMSQSSLELMKFMGEPFNLPEFSLLSESNTSIEYENFTPMIRVSANGSVETLPQKEKNNVKYENFTPRQSANLNPKSSVKTNRTANSVLIHFDPLLQNMFIDNEPCVEPLDSIFMASPVDTKPSNVETSMLEEKLSEISDPSGAKTLMVEELKEIPVSSCEETYMLEKIAEISEEIPEENNTFEVACLPSESDSFKLPSPKTKECDISSSSVYYKVHENVSRVPEPPLRQDSIPREDISKMNTFLSGSLSGTVTQIPKLNTVKLMNNVTDESKTKRVSAFKRLTQNILQKQQTGTVHEKRYFSKPSVGFLNSEIIYSGSLLDSGKERNTLKVVLKNSKLTWNSERGKQELLLDELTSISGYTSTTLATHTSAPLQCLKLAWQKPGQATQMFVFLATSVECRSDWLHNILQATCHNCFPYHTTHGFTIAGWLHFKEGVSGDWMPCWMLLKERTLYFSFQPENVLEADLRKARCIQPQLTGGFIQSFGCVLIELQEGRALYLQSINEKDTNRWGYNIRVAALSNGPALEQQQLTKDDVPVLVDKCVNFVFQQGSLSEGVYRRSGVMSTVSNLLKDFVQDAWAVQLTPAKYTEHDVATALKRFFKNLPDPLIPYELTHKLCKLTALRDLQPDDKIAKYRRILRHLKPVAYNTLRRILGHLHFLHRESSKNLMTASVLAPIWGVSLMHPKSKLLGESHLQATVELITLYPRLYDVSEAEIAREMQMLNLLEKYQTVINVARPSGDLKIWVSIDKPSSAETVQVAIGPQKTALQVCKELGRGAHYMLQEIVLGGALSRPIHPTEKLFDVVVRWGYWDEEDRKDNLLLLAPCPLYEDILPLAKPPFAACGELKYADTKSKAFKLSVLEFKQAKLSFYKGRKLNATPIEWRIEDIVWYIGHEKKRDPQTSWAITFVLRHNKPKRSREKPYFGHTIAGSNQQEMLRWCAAMLLAEHP